MAGLNAEFQNRANESSIELIHLKSVLEDKISNINSRISMLNTQRAGTTAQNIVVALINKGEERENSAQHETGQPINIREFCVAVSETLEFL
jgi:hypothetical protein